MTAARRQVLARSRALHQVTRPSQYLDQRRRASTWSTTRPSTSCSRIPTSRCSISLAAPSFVDHRPQGGGGARRRSRRPDAKAKDKATEWLNQNSAGTGPYQLTGWVRNSQIQLVANPNYWGGKPAFQRIVIRHFEDGAAQMLALAARRHRRRVQPAARAGRLAEGREGRLDRTADQPRLRLYGADSQPRVQQGAGQQVRAPGDRLCDRLRRHQRFAAGRRGDAAGQLHSGRLAGLDRGAHARRSASGRTSSGRRSCSRRPGMPDGFEFEVIYGNASSPGRRITSSRRSSSPISRASASR